MIDLENLVLAQINGTDSWVTNTNLFRGQPRGAPDDSSIFTQLACFVWLSSSGRPLYFAGDGTKAENSAVISFAVRGSPEQVATARTKAQAVLDLLDNTPPTGVFAAFVDSAVAVNSGFDAQNAPLVFFSITYKWYE